MQTKIVRNVGPLDRIVRLIIGAAALIFILKGEVSGIALVVLIIGGTVGLFTGIYGACPAYHSLKISTSQKK